MKTKTRGKASIVRRGQRALERLEEVLQFPIVQNDLKEKARIQGEVATLKKRLYGER
jgi:hypothetical protein